MPEYMCQYGSCSETDVRITVSVPSDNERVRFCSFIHLALWAKNRAKRNQEFEYQRCSVTEQVECGLLKESK